MSKFSNIIKAANAIPRWPFTINRQSEQARGLELWYPLTPQYGGAAISPVHSLRPSIVGPSAINDQSVVTWNGASCAAGAALHFTPSTAAYITLGNTADIVANNTTASFAFWYRKTDSTLRAAFVFESNTVGAVFQRIALHLPYSNGTAYWDFGNYSANGRLSVAITTTTMWEHWVVTVEPGAMAIYRNGVRIASKASSETLTPASTFQLGSANATIPPDDAELTDFRYYSTSLSAAEVWALYDPATRYELYQPLSRRVYGFAPSVAFTYKDASARLQALSGIKTSSSILRSASARLTTQSTVHSAISRAVAAHAEIIARSTVAGKANRLAGASAKLTTRSNVQSTSSLLRGASVRIESRASMQTRASAWRAVAAQLQARSGILCGAIEQLSIAPGRLFDVPYEQRVFRVRYEDRTFRVPRA